MPADLHLMRCETRQIVDVTADLGQSRAELDRTLADPCAVRRAGCILERRPTSADAFCKQVLLIAIVSGERLCGPEAFHSRRYSATSTASCSPNARRATASNSRAAVRRTVPAGGPRAPCTRQRPVGDLRPPQSPLRLVSCRSPVANWLLLPHLIAGRVLGRGSTEQALQLAFQVGDEDVVGDDRTLLVDQNHHR